MRLRIPNVQSAYGFERLAQTRRLLSRKRLFGYTSLVWATVCITVLSFIVFARNLQFVKKCCVSMYAIVMNVVIPARISVLTVVLFSFSLKNFSTTPSSFKLSNKNFMKCSYK